jgi:hypothetical protein
LTGTEHVSFASRWRRKAQVVVNPMKPIEVPVLTETKRLLARREYEKAVLYAYPAVLLDVERAYGVQFSPNWTHEEVLVHGMRPGMERLPEFLLVLYRLYEPVRYGRNVPAQGDSLVGALQSIYSHRPMWELYKELLLSGNPSASPDPTAISGPLGP